MRNIQKILITAAIVALFGWIVFDSPIGIQAILHQEAIRAGQN